MTFHFEKMMQIWIQTIRQVMLSPLRMQATPHFYGFIGLRGAPPYFAYAFPQTDAKMVFFWLTSVLNINIQLPLERKTFTIILHKKDGRYVTFMLSLHGRHWPSTLDFFPSVSSPKNPFFNIAVQEDWESVSLDLRVETCLTLLIYVLCK